MRMPTMLLLLLIVVCTYARSFSDVDIPDPPQFKKHIQETKDENLNKSLNDTTQNPITTKAPTQKPTTTKVPTQNATSTKAPTQQPATTKAPTQKPTTLPTAATQPTTTKPTTLPTAATQPTTTKPTTLPTAATQPTTTKTTTQQPTTTKATTQKPTTTSTTMDPWDEFCKEACEEGLAGPECDCPEHPIGRRSVGKARHRRSTFIDTAETHGSESMKHHYTSKAKPTVNLKVKRLLMKYCKEVCDHGIQNDLCKCSGVEIKPGYVNNDPAFNINGSSIDKGSNTTEAPGGVEKTTTKDPLEEFCENACADGEGTLACNCHDHIIGRRRRSVQAFTAHHGKSFPKTLDSASFQNIQRSSGQYQDASQLKNTLSWVKLHKDSVQPQDLNVQFPFRTLPEITKAHKEKVHKNSSP